MSDELTIQPQVQQKSNAVPYAAGGAIVGGLAGALSPVGVTKQKYASYEDILKESKDTFDSQIEKGGDNKGVWEAAKEHAEKVKNAEAEYDKKVQEIKDANTSKAGALPEDNEVAKQLKDAQTKYDSEFEKLVQAEEKKLGSTRTVSSLPTPDEMRLGIKGDDAAKVGKDWKFYDETLKPNYDNEVKKVKTVAGTPGNAEYVKAENGLKNYKIAIENYYNAVADAVAEKDPKQKVKKERGLGKRLDSIVENEYNYSADADIKAKAFKEGKMREAKGRFSSLTADYTDPKTGKKYVFNDGVSLKQLRKADNTRVDALRDTLAEEIKATSSEYSTAKAELKNFEGQKTFQKYNKKGNISGSYVCELSDINGKDAVKTYKHELEVVEKLADPKKAKKIKPSDITDLQTKYGLNPKDINENGLVKDKIKARLSLAEQYAEKLKTVESAMGGQSRIGAYKADMDKAVNTNADVKAAAKKIKNMAKKYGINVDTVADADISAKAKEAAQKAIEGKQVAIDLKTATDNAVKEAEKLGIKDGELTAKGKQLLEELGSKENYTTKVKNAAKEAIEKDLGKIKTPNKLVNGLIAGTALALVGLGIGSSMKKDQA